MTWRVIEQDGQRWHVFVAAEQRLNSRDWSLVFCFRRPGERSIWVPSPISSPSKGALFSQADSMSNDTLLDLLAQVVTGGGAA